LKKKKLPFFVSSFHSMPKPSILNITLSIFLLFALSCISGNQKKEKEFLNSKIYPKITCLSDTNLSYALFLPPLYEKGKPCPVLILFDSHGDGLLPITIFSDEASKNGFIIAGSNNSKNGMPTDQTTAIYRNIIDDLTKRFSIEKKAVYLGGFSGGSRVAGAAAISESGIAGVVGCGAGLPNTAQHPVNPFSYLAVVGNQDFNFTEMQQLDKILEQANYKHHLLVFDGIHQWPPKEVIPEIFTWIRFDAMRTQALPTNRNEVNTFIENNDKVAMSLAANGNAAGQQQVYIKMMHYLQNLTDIVPLQSEINRLGKDKNVISYHEKQQQILLAEQELQRKYAPEILRESIEWWTAETRKLRAMSEKPADTDMAPVYSRILGYLSLNCYMLANGALKQGELVPAAKYIEIYRLVDPANAEHRYLAGKVAALNHQTNEALTALEQAFELGFKDNKRLNSDPDFTFLQNEARFRKLVEKK